MKGRLITGLSYINNVMKTSALLLFFILSVQLNVKGQASCNSSRYDSEIFPTVITTTDLLYGNNLSTSGTPTDLTLDVYEPVGDTLAMRPLIIWAHGGSFVGGTKNDGDVVSLCQHFAKRGYVCVSINYRLGLSAFPPTAAAAKQAVYRAVQDMKAAVRYFRSDAANANTFRIDPNIIFAGGSSAGAFTALHLAYMDSYSELPSEIDTTVMGNLEGNSGNPGYVSTVNAVIDLCGALGDKTWIKSGDVPFVAMHGTNDGTVPYATATIYLLGAFPVMVVDGSYSITQYANTVPVSNDFYTYFGADHVPYSASTAYMDTTVRFVSNFLYRYLGCNPADPTPLPNTFTTGINNITANNDITIFPNPADDYLNVKSQNGNTITFAELIDFSGRRIKTISDHSDFFRIDVRSLSHGIYFLKVRSALGETVRKVVL